MLSAKAPWRLIDEWHTFGTLPGMATTKQRINISVSRRTAETLRHLAKRDQEPLATKATRLLEQALELEEDRFLSAIADERLKNHRGKWLSHEEVWGKKRTS